jgi:hypothetical protein
VAIHFFDSCGLQHRYVHSEYSEHVDEVIANAPDACYIAEWSILEMSSAIANRVRQGSLSVLEFDKLNNLFLGDVASGRLQVLNMSAKHYRRARDLVRYAGVVRGWKLQSGDAMIATVAQGLAIDRREKVTFHTSDWKLFYILRGINAFTTRLDLVFLGKAKA